jgi:hypothetical protein
MIIANPIYDVGFKRLMENEKVAKFFISTLLEQNVESVEVKPQEFTYLKDFDQDDPKVIEYTKKKMRERLSINVFRLDFIATIKTETGEYKKILIEIQKAQKLIDLMRFRNYLAEQYKKEDVINNERVVLPITTIYILGFKLPEIQSPCVRVKRDYVDLINQTVITEKSDFIEKLTHDSFVVQVERITDRYQTRLDKLLSVFEQTNFTDDREIIKDYTHNPDIEEVKTITDILHFVGTSPKERKELEVEQEAWRTINAMFDEKERRYQEELAEQRKMLEQKDQALTEKDRLIEELMRKLNEQNK